MIESGPENPNSDRPHRRYLMAALGITPRQLITRRQEFIERLAQVLNIDPAEIKISRIMEPPELPKPPSNN